MGSKKTKQELARIKSHKIRQKGSTYSLHKQLGVQEKPIKRKPSQYKTNRKLRSKMLAASAASKPILKLRKMNSSPEQASNLAPSAEHQLSNKR